MMGITLKLITYHYILGKKRVFNYRIVQIKSDIELDMRGRCSAGQKVKVTTLFNFGVILY